MDSVSPSQIELFAIASAEEFARLEKEWRDLEARSADATPYLGYDWLSAWLRIYRPERVAAIRLGENGSAHALGLVEQGKHGRWRFAGYPVTSHRSLLCAAGREGACWSELTAWLRDHAHSWSTLDLEGAGAAAAVLPSARLSPDHFFVAPLPSSFDAYVAERGSRTRRTIRQLLRRFEQSALEVREPSDHERSIAEFARLHQARARAMGQNHWQIDDRLSRLVLDLYEAGRLRLSMRELVEAGRTLAVSILIEYRNTLYAYNIGVDCSQHNFSPGLLLLVESVREAIAAGLERADLGPGEYRYKRELGAVPVERYRMSAAAPTPRGRLLGFSSAARGEIRSRVASERMRRLVSPTRKRFVSRRVETGNRY
jgi:CelD/BcsL family acetyltransferase involved in cellulose biosynthesis